MSCCSAALPSLLRDSIVAVCSRSSVTLYPPLSDNLPAQTSRKVLKQLLEKIVLYGFYKNGPDMSLYS